MGNIKARLAKLEKQSPDELLVIHVRWFPEDDPPLTPEEEAVLEAEKARRLQETKNGVVVMYWSREEAQRLGALAQEEV